jgi:hypothetical protein
MSFVYLSGFCQADHPLAGFIGGASASMASAGLGVPLDVISQRLMVQNMKNEVIETQYKGGLSSSTVVWHYL